MLEHFLNRSFLFRQILPGLEPLLLALSEIAKKRGKTMPQVNYYSIRLLGRRKYDTLKNEFNLFLQVAINWCICKGTVPIPGIKSVRHVEDNLGALGWKLTNDEQLQLEYAAKESPKSMIQNIFQTR